MQYSIREIAEKANVSSLNVVRNIIKGEFYYDNYEIIELNDEELHVVIECIKQCINLNTLGVWRTVKYKNIRYFLDNEKYSKTK